MYAFFHSNTSAVSNIFHDEKQLRNCFEFIYRMHIWNVCDCMTVRVPHAIPRYVELIRDNRMKEIELTRYSRSHNLLTAKHTHTHNQMTQTKCECVCVLVLASMPVRTCVCRFEYAVWHLSRLVRVVRLLVAHTQELFSSFFFYFFCCFACNNRIATKLSAASSIHSLFVRT